MHAGFSRRTFITAAGAGAAALGMGGQANAGARIHRRERTLPDSASITVTDPALLSAVEAASLLQERKLHPRELLDACLARSAGHDGDIGSWVRIYPDVAREQAQRAGDRLAEAGVRRDGAAPLVCGLPIALKDLFAVEGLPLTASSRVLEGNIAAGDATVWRRLRESGMVLIGHAHTHEFALGSGTPQTGNPWDTAASVGGSSGGSAAVLAARFAPLATGTDTGGSLRFPASVCGVTSIKPTFGRCSTYGVIPVAWNRDHVGVMGRSVADAALLLAHMAGADPHDPVTLLGPDVGADGYPLVARGGRKPLSGKVFGLPATVTDDLPQATAALFDDFLGLVRELGGEIVDVTMPPLPKGLLLGDQFEAGAFHQQFSDRVGSYDPVNAAQVTAAVAALAGPVADQWKLGRERTTYQRAYNRLFTESRLDAVLVPGSIHDGMRRGAGPNHYVNGAAQWANLSGAPVVCTPAGRSAATGIPFGVQIGGKPWDEAGLISLALELQAARPHWRDAPELPASPRTIPEATRTKPGPGPDPTNTDAAPPAFRFAPTTVDVSV
ncbi:amidase [Rhodococcus sp. NPDC127528]|uniref:amidase n=1 Tax=unclassified Rhodococcus (in: high G+C Gram-positive bacteria) TaxID=192944 RepID=UPI0036431978